MIVSDLVRDYPAQTRPAPDPVLEEMEEHGARRVLPRLGDGMLIAVKRSAR